MPRTRFTPHLRVALPFGQVRTAHPLPSGALYTREAKLPCPALVSVEDCGSATVLPSVSCADSSLPYGKEPFYWPIPCGGHRLTLNNPTFPALTSRQAGPATQAWAAARPTEGRARIRPMPRTGPHTSDVWQGRACDLSRSIVVQTIPPSPSVTPPFTQGRLNCRAPHSFHSPPAGR